MWLRSTTITRAEWDALDVTRPITDEPMQCKAPRPAHETPESLLDIYTGGIRRDID